jgi:hypothetical protein
LSTKPLTHFKNDEYLIRLEFKSKAIYGSAPLSTLLKGHEAQIQQLFQQSSDAMAFLVALKELVETISSPKAPFYYSSKRYASIIQQLQHIGFDNIHSLNDTLTEIIFQK